MGNAYGHSMHKPDGMFSTLIDGPSVALISTAEAKAHLRVDSSDEDTLIDSLVQAATDYLDAEHGILGRALITQRWRLTVSDVPTGDFIYLPVPRAQQVVSVSYYDQDNTEQTFASDNYRLVVNDSSAVIELAAGAAWPVAYDRVDAMWIDYDAGYGDAASDVPQAIRQAALLLVGHWFEHRSQVSGSSVVELPFAVQHLLQPFRIPRGHF